MFTPRGSAMIDRHADDTADRRRPPAGQTISLRGLLRRVKRYVKWQDTQNTWTEQDPREWRARQSLRRSRAFLRWLACVQLTVEQRHELVRLEAPDGGAVPALGDADDPDDDEDDQEDDEE